MKVWICDNKFLKLLRTMLVRLLKHSYLNQPKQLWIYLEESPNCSRPSTKPERQALGNCHVLCKANRHVFKFGFQLWNFILQSHGVRFIFFTTKVFLSQERVHNWGNWSKIQYLKTLAQTQCGSFLHPWFFGSGAYWAIGQFKVSEIVRESHVRLTQYNLFHQINLCFLLHILAWKYVSGNHVGIKHIQNTKNTHNEKKQTYLISTPLLVSTNTCEKIGI